jgi:hypothetical protein
MQAIGPATTAIPLCTQLLSSALQATLLLLLWQHPVHAAPVISLARKTCHSYPRSMLCWFLVLMEL